MLSNLGVQLGPIWARLLLWEPAKNRAESRKRAKHEEIEAIRLVTRAPQGAHRFAFKFIIRSRPRFRSNVVGKSTHSSTLGFFAPRADSSNLRCSEFYSFAPKKKKKRTKYKLQRQPGQRNEKKPTNFNSVATGINLSLPRVPCRTVKEQD